jgi:hypothetical protein
VTFAPAQGDTGITLDVGTVRMQRERGRTAKLALGMSVQSHDGQSPTVGAH